MPRKTNGTRRSKITARRGGGSLKNKVFHYAKKFGLIFGLIIFIVWLGAWFFLSGASKSSWNYLEEKVVENAADQGVRVENILIEGRVHTDIELLKAIINTEKGDPLLDFDPASVQPLIQRISWVKEVQVLRRMPDTIHIILEEYKPYALWQHHNEIVVTSRDGTVLTDTLKDDFKNLIILTGEKAPERASELIEMLHAEPDIAQHVEGAMLVGNRRWDLKLKDGKIISLPEEDIGFALRRLSEAQQEDEILQKDIARIDLREPDRIIVEGN